MLKSPALSDATLNVLLPTAKPSLMSFSGAWTLPRCNLLCVSLISSRYHCKQTITANNLKDKRLKANCVTSDVVNWRNKSISLHVLWPPLRTNLFRRLWLMGPPPIAQLPGRTISLPSTQWRHFTNKRGTPQTGYKMDNWQRLDGEVRLSHQSLLTEATFITSNIGHETERVVKHCRPRTFQFLSSYFSCLWK